MVKIWWRERSYQKTDKNWSWKWKRLIKQSSWRLDNSDLKKIWRNIKQMWKIIINGVKINRKWKIIIKFTIIIKLTLI